MFYSKFPKITKKSKISYPKTRHLEISDESVQSSNLTPTQLTSYEQKKKTRERKKKNQGQKRKTELGDPGGKPIHYSRGTCLGGGTTRREEE